MDGLPGTGVRAALYAVTFVEVLTAGFMANMMSMLILFAAKPVKAGRSLAVVFTVLLCAHAALLLAAWPLDLIYYFDAGNVYHRASGYLLSNLCPLLMLVIDVFLLIRYRQNYERRVKSAFWFYVVAPIAAIAIQSLLYGIQFIILATVSAAINMFSVIVRKQNEEFEAQQMEHSRIETELNTASSIQTHMLPNLFPVFPERDEFDIYATMEPAKEVGGDFYDFFLIDEDHLGLVMADVSGKGVPAALFMVIAKTLIKNQAQMGEYSPAKVLARVNEQLCEGNEAELFVTVWLAILEISTGKGRAANAGLEHPTLRRAGGKFELVEYRHSPAVATMEGIRFREHEFTLRPGDSLFVYTDGVAEATDAHNTLYGTERMLAALNEAPDAAPEEVLAAVKRSVDAFVGDAPQFDDITMLCLKYNGAGKKGGGE